MGDTAIAEAEVEIAAELVHELDADGKQLRVVKLTDYTVPRSRERERVVPDRVRVAGSKTRCSAEKVRTLCASPDELRARWADVTGLKARHVTDRPEGPGRTSTHISQAL